MFCVQLCPFHGQDHLVLSNFEIRQTIKYDIFQYLSIHSYSGIYADCLESSIMLVILPNIASKQYSLFLYPKFGLKMSTFQSFIYKAITSTGEHCSDLTFICFYCSPPKSECKLLNQLKLCEFQLRNYYTPTGILSVVFSVDFIVIH